MKSKIHRATITAADLEYPGSITVDRDLMRKANLVPYEQVHVLDVENGARFETYVIEGAAESGTVCVNGAAARLVHPGDKVIIISYALYSDTEYVLPLVVSVDEANRSLEHLIDVSPRQPKS